MGRFGEDWAERIWQTQMDAVFLPLRAYALTLLPIGFALRSVLTHISKQFCIEMCVTLSPIGFALISVPTHISKQFCIEMCVCTLLKVNPMDRRVRAYALKGKINLPGHKWIGRLKFL